MDRFLAPNGKKKISGVMHYSGASAPAIVCCHGLFSHKDSEKFLQVAEAFGPAGYTVVRFDFAGCGDSDGDIADTTVTSRLQDLQAVVQHLSGLGVLDGSYGLLGSSLGGYVGLLHAAQNPVAALSVWATPCDLPSLGNKFSKADLERLKQDFFVDARGYDLLSAIGAVRSVQVLHGAADELVPSDHARRIFSMLPEPRDLVVLQGADHALSAVSSRQQAVTLGLAWFRRQMPPG